MLKQVIAELNILFKSMGLEFESFHWVDDVTPGITDNAQSRINAQASGYDIIIALLGSRLGTPTAEWDSGTVEEIELAITDSENKTFKEDSIIVAFKNVQLDTVSGNLEEAARVQKFRKNLSGRLIYKEYEDDTDLKAVFLGALSPILHKHILSDQYNDNNYIKSHTAEFVKGGELGGEISVEDDLDDTDGLLDLVVSSEKNLGAATKSLNNITSAASNVGETMERVASDISSGKKDGDVAFMVRSMKEISESMSVAADIFESESYLMKLAFESAIDDVEKILEISRDDFDESEVDTSILTNSLEELHENMLGGLEPLSNFRNMLMSLPKIDKGLNRAKIRLMKSLDLLDVAMRAILDRSAEVKVWVR